MAQHIVYELKATRNDSRMHTSIQLTAYEITAERSSTTIDCIMHTACWVTHKNGNLACTHSAAHQSNAVLALYVCSRRNRVLRCNGKESAHSFTCCCKSGVTAARPRYIRHNRNSIASYLCVICGHVLMHIAWSRSIGSHQSHILVAVCRPKEAERKQYAHCRRMLNRVGKLCAEIQHMNGHPRHTDNFCQCSSEQEARLLHRVFF